VKFWLIRHWRNLFGGGRGILLNVRDVTAQLQWHALRAEELHHVMIEAKRQCEGRAVVWRECLAMATALQNEIAVKVASEQLILLERTAELVAKSASEGQDSVDRIGADLQQSIQTFRNLRARFEQTGVDVRKIVLPNMEVERAKARATISTTWEANLLPEGAARELMRAMESR
jgi:hypothetical protein